MRIEKNTILANLNTNDIQTVKNKIADIQKAVPVIERHSNESKTRLDSAQKEYTELKEQAQNFDIDELYDLRRNIRTQVEYDTEAELYVCFKICAKAHILKQVFVSKQQIAKNVLTA